MFDCGGPTLVFVTQTLHPVLEHHTGYIFGYYDIHFRKVKEMFFQHIAEAQVFALYRGARFEMDPSRKPDTVTAVDYILSAEEVIDESFREERGRTSKGGYRPRRQRIDAEFDSEAVSELQPTDMLVEEEVNWFGDE